MCVGTGQPKLWGDVVGVLVNDNPHGICAISFNKGIEKQNDYGRATQDE